MKIYIIRHGQTDWNVNKIIQGQKDIELNNTGEEQARNQIKIFNEYNFDLIISSTLKRAQKTAQIINSEKNVDIIYDDRLRERNFGDYEGTPSNFDEDPIYNLKTNIKELATAISDVTGTAVAFSMKLLAVKKFFGELLGCLDFRISLRLF